MRRDSAETAEQKWQNIEMRARQGGGPERMTRVRDACREGEPARGKAETCLERRVVAVSSKERLAITLIAR